MATVSPPVPAGQAHVATVSFLTSRAAPAGGFWIALAGGVALARVAQRLGARQGYGASIAAILETVALMGPARFSVPLTQALTAPLLGRMEARGAGTLPQVLVCGAIRLVHNAATSAFFIWVITGGLDAYAGTYDALAGRVGLEIGTADALVVTTVGLVVWAAFASTVQVLVYRRGLARWEEASEIVDREEPAVAASAGRFDPAEPPASPAGRAGRFDPRLVAAAAAVAFLLLLSGTDWPLLAAIAAWLALAWAFSRADSAPVATGLALTALIAGGALVFTLGAGLGLDLALRRTLRAALLVLVATWLRAAAGAEGLREVSRRALGRLRRLPALPEAARTLAEIGSEGRLVAAGRSLAGVLEGVRMRPLPVIDAVLAWVKLEAGRYGPGRAAAPLELSTRPADWVLLALAAAPVVALAA
jgi:hypothetical protein